MNGGWGVPIILACGMTLGLLILGLYEIAALFTGLPTISTMTRIVIAHFAPRAVGRADVRRGQNENAT